MSDQFKQVTKRDHLEIEQIAKKPLGALFATYDGETYPTAEFMLAAKYLAEKKNGLTGLDYDDWLDGEAADVQVEVDPT